MDLRRKVESYNTWYDQCRTAARIETKGASWRKVRTALLALHRSAAIASAGGVYARFRSNTRLLQLVADLPNFRNIVEAREILSRPELQKRIALINALLPDPLPELTIEDPLGPVLAIYERRGLPGYGTEKHLYRSEDAEHACALIFLHQMADFLASDLIADSHLLVMESDLARQVVASNNQEVRAEDLKALPFARSVIEFSTPLLLLRHDEAALKAMALGLTKAEGSQAALATWYVHTESNPINEASCAGVMALPDGSLHAIVDPVIYGLLGIDTSARSERDVQAWTSIVREQIWTATRNMLDFVSCRNIDYETYHRPGRALSRIKKYRHIPNIDGIGPRIFKILRVDRRIRMPSDPRRMEQPSASELPYREHIPGAFHKWIYCAACNRCHRHDLIGRPCRRCNSPVGPVSNIVIKKWWHEPYVRGPEGAPWKDVVRCLAR